MGLPAVVNNASAISNTPTLETTMKKYDLMHGVNGRGTFVTTKACLPHLLKSRHTPHVLTLSPPLNLDPRWIALAGPAYTAAKYNMSLFTLGMSEEFRGKVAFNSLWPRTAIATAAIKMLAGNAGMMASRTPEIMADAAHAVFCQGVEYSGNFCIDDEVLRSMRGLTDSDLDKYANGPVLMPDFYIGSVDAMKKWMKMGDMVGNLAGMFGMGKKKKSE
jgi:citronellol/citronellal dehydrogenase